MADTNNNDELLKMIDAEMALTKESTIKELKKELEKNVCCPHCRSYIPRGKQFCILCGRKIEDKNGKDKIVEEERRLQEEIKSVKALSDKQVKGYEINDTVCTNCLERVPDFKQFCINCGKEVEDLLWWL